MKVGKNIGGAGPGGADTRVITRFFRVSAALSPYASIIYLTEIDAPPGVRVADYLHPEWANLRFISGEPPLAAIGGTTPEAAPAFIAAGPTSMATYFAAGTMRAWGVGLLPTGWTKFVPLSAEALADGFCDGAVHPAFAAFAPLGPKLTCTSNPEEGAQMIDDHLVGLLASAPADDSAIFAAHRALLDDDVRSVADLSAALNLSERSVERLSRRAFGFPPKLLLRRQRFLRSLARFMLDPSMAWTATLDHHYHDQAQFTRDFQRFMGMSPRAYAARPKPILGAAALARAAAAGEAVQGLHRPD